MRKEQLPARDGWQETVARQGLSFATTPLPDGGTMNYWRDDAAYVFSLAEIERLEDVTAQLWKMSLTALEHVLETGAIERFGLPAESLELLRWSYRESGHPSIYGRFDVAWDGNGDPKLLEFNADTPTGLIESAVCQWYWLMDQKPDHDQYNSLHERLVDAWKRASSKLPLTVYFAAMYDGDEGEDWLTAMYMRDTAMEAGLKTEALEVTDIGWNPATEWFVDGQGTPIAAAFKLYPWEDLLQEEFAQHLWATRLKTRWIEPAWKAILSNKALLAVLWELFPDHPLLLPAYLGSPGPLTEYAEKPLHGREGDSVRLHTANGDITTGKDSRYGSEGFCYQQYCPLPDFDGAHPVLGLWLVSGKPAGMGIRESKSLITDYYASFVPHYIEDAAVPDNATVAEWIAEDFAT